MKVYDNFLLRKVADSYVVVPVGKATLDFNGMITLNETGAFLWEHLQKETTKEELLKCMLDEYTVDEETAKNGIEKFLKKIKEAGLLET